MCLSHSTTRTQQHQQQTASLCVLDWVERHDETSLHTYTNQSLHLQTTILPPRNVTYRTATQRAAMHHCAQSKNSVTQRNCRCGAPQVNRNEFYFSVRARTTANQRRRQQCNYSNYFVMACVSTWTSFDLHCVALWSFLAATQNANIAVWFVMLHCGIILCSV